LRKFMVAFDEEVFRELDKDARSRNISLQSFLRAVVVPEWIRNGNNTMANDLAIRDPQTHKIGVRH
jgi:hypothetical protein